MGHKKYYGNKLKHELFSILFYEYKGTLSELLDRY